MSFFNIVVKIVNSEHSGALMIWAVHNGVSMSGNRMKWDPQQLKRA
jgi:hypothetical protein